MTPSQCSVLALLALVTSVHGVPAGLPAQNQPAPRQIGLEPPSFSISWDTSAPQPTEDPEDPEEPEEPEEPENPFPVPTQSNQISLSPPSFSISWDTGVPAPGPTEDPEEPEFPGPFPTRRPWPGQTNLPTRRPSGRRTRFSISWFTGRPKNTGGVSWNAEVPSNTGGVSWDGPQPTAAPETPLDPSQLPIGNQPKPSDQISNNQPTNTVIWGKRQFEEDPEPTEDPEPEPGPQPGPGLGPVPDDPEPEDPEGPIDIPPFLPTQLPPNTIGFEPPQVSFSWGKRQEDEPEPTGPIEIPPSPPQVTPPNQISIQPPVPSVSWGKRQEDEDPEPTGPIEILPPPQGTPPNQISLQPPVPSVSWGKPQDEPEPTSPIEIPLPPQATPPDEISLMPPSSSISWGKRAAQPQTNSYGFEFTRIIPSFSTPQVTKRQDEEPEPTEDPGDDFPDPAQPTPPDNIGLQPPTATVIWGRDAVPEPTAAPVLDESRDEAKREADPEAQFSLNFPSEYPFPWWPQPSQPFLSWGKRDAAPEPTAAPNQENREVLPRDSTSKPSFFPTPLKPTPVPIGTLATSAVVPQPSGLCPTITALVAPPCVPPICPHAGETPCDYNKPIPAMQKVRRDSNAEKVEVVEKRLVTITTVTPIGTPTPVTDKCTQAVTKTMFAPCPTYTCVPWTDCDVAQIVR